MNRNSVAALAAAAAVVIAIILGFWNLGAPSQQRRVRQDARAVQALHNLAEQINRSWNLSDRTLPANLDRFPANATEDPTTSAPFIYHPKTAGQYELCAIFLTDNRNDASQERTSFWTHPSGAHCFQLNADVPVPPAPYFYGY